MDELQSAVQRVKETDFTPLWTVLKRVFGDLGEGFQGLGKSAREFELQGAVEGLQQKFDRELALRAPGGGVSSSTSVKSNSAENSDNNKSSVVGGETSTTGSGHSDAVVTSSGGGVEAEKD